METEVYELKSWKSIPIVVIPFAELEDFKLFTLLIKTNKSTHPTPTATIPLAEDFAPEASKLFI